MLIQVGEEEEEERRERIDLTPYQILPIFFWLSLKYLVKKLLITTVSCKAKQFCCDTFLSSHERGL